ncbi:response regulator [bacterium]|nr:response regulator [bacterium]
MVKAKRTKVLIIDDERDMCWILRKVFEDVGYKVVTAHKGREGIEKARKDRADLAILDLKLPDMNGLEVLPTLKKINPKMSIVVITAFGTQEMKEAALDLGADHFLDKPFRVEKILKVTREALSRK